MVDVFSSVVDGGGRRALQVEPPTGEAVRAGWGGTVGRLVGGVKLQGASEQEKVAFLLTSQYKQVGLGLAAVHFPRYAKRGWLQ